MNIHQKASVFVVCLLVSGCATHPARQQAKNPLLSPSPLPFQAPPFDKITDADFAPAFDAGMEEQLAEVTRIADDPAQPSFDNTIEALEKTGRTLNRVSLVFNALSGANTDDKLERLQEQEAPKLAAQQDDIDLNPKLFARIEKLYNSRDQLGLDPEGRRLLEYDYQQFVMAGARLSEGDKDKLKKLNQEDAGLSAKFINQLLAATKAGALVVRDQSELAGLSQADLDAAAEAAKSGKLDGAWLLALQNTTQQPLLQSLAKRETRRKLFNASWMLSVIRKSSFLSLSPA
jgi:peptidyl-dipeptidase Dcp